MLSDEIGRKAVVADVYDPAIPNSDGAGPTARRVHGVDVRASEHEIGWRVARAAIFRGAGAQGQENQQPDGIHHTVTENTEGSLTGASVVSFWSYLAPAGKFFIR